MKYKTVTLQKVINLGNYESQRLEISVEVNTEDEDELNDMMLELYATVEDNLTRFKKFHEQAKLPEGKKKDDWNKIPF